MARRVRTRGGVLAVGLAAMVSGAAGGPGPAAAQLSGEAPLSCGAMGVAAYDGTDPVTVPAGAEVGVLDAPIVVGCPDGPVVATFTVEVSGAATTVAFVSLVAQCQPPEPGTAAPACVPGEALPLRPGRYRVPLALAAGPEARTVSAAAILPRGAYRVFPFVNAVGGPVNLERMTLSVLAGGFPAGPGRPGIAPSSLAPGASP
jgi:hypothetical protein